MSTKNETQEMMTLLSEMMTKLNAMEEKNMKLQEELEKITVKKSRNKSKKAKKNKSDIRKTQPIKDLDTYNNFLNVLKPRDRLMCLIGIASALRIGDIIILRRKDVVDESGVIRITEYGQEKTYKETNVVFGDEFSAEIRDLLDELSITEDNQLLFASQKLDEFGNPKPISRQQAWNIITAAAIKIGVRKRDSDGKLVGLRLGSHSLRKTFSFWFYTVNSEKGRAAEALAYLTKILNHSDPAVTLRYIGIEQEKIEEGQVATHNALKRTRG
jgi:integrase